MLRLCKNRTYELLCSDGQPLLLKYRRYHYRYVRKKERNYRYNYFKKSWLLCTTNYH